MTEQLSQAIMLIDDVRNALENEHPAEYVFIIRWKEQRQAIKEIFALQDRFLLPLQVLRKEIV